MFYITLTIASALTLVAGFVVPVSQSASYDLGQAYHYNYLTTLVLGEPGSGSVGKNVTFQVTADVTATNVWGNPLDSKDGILLLKINKPKLLVIPKDGEEGVLSGHISPLDKHVTSFVAVHLLDGTISGLYAGDDQSALFSVQAGIASLFQFQYKNKVVEEMDTSGRCSVTYKVTGKMVEKTKRDCRQQLPQDHALRSGEVLGTISSSAQTSIYELNNDHVISNARTKEILSLSLSIFPESGVLANSNQKLSLVNKVAEQKHTVEGEDVDEAISRLAKVLGSQLRPSGFHVSHGKQSKSSLCKNLPETIRSKRESLLSSNLAKTNAAAAFLDLVQRTRDCDKDIIVKILKHSKNKDILPQLLDVAAAAQTAASIQAVLEVLDFDSDAVDLPERFLISLSIVQYPTESTLQSLLELAKQGSRNSKLEETMLLTVATLCKSYVKNKGKGLSTIDEVKAMFATRLSECPNDSCKLLYLRAYRNAAFPDSVAILLGAAGAGGKVATEALKALRGLPRNVILKKETLALQKIYHQLLKKHESTSRVISAQLLLESNPSEDTIRDLLLSLSYNGSVETNAYLLGKINDLVLRDISFRTKVHSVIKNLEIGNYHTFAQSGSSTAFAYPLADFHDLNATYGLNLEMVGGGLLKYSTFDVQVESKTDSLNLLSFGLFAGGLGSLAGESTTDGDDKEEMTAGIELSVLGVALRPYTLFTGQGDLMGLVWSGTGSDPTPVHQGNYLLQDHQHRMGLQSGFVLVGSFLGALSCDISGSIQISIWNRNSHSIVENKAALVIQSVVRLDSSFITAQVATTDAGQSSVDFETNLEFYDSPFKMCTQMSQKPFTFKHIVHKIERIPGSKHSIRRTRKTSEDIFGKSFALHKKNSNLCSLMLK